MTASVVDLLDGLAREIIATRPQRPAMIGLGGAQGCGKSFHCCAFARDSGLRVAHFSLDDVYLTLAEREEMARAIHPLFITRGPPGTHDLEFARTCVGALMSARPDQETRLPRFDKARDDRAPEKDWPVFVGRPDVIVIDGWLIPAAPPVGTPTGPINALEEIEDPHRIWRNHMLTPLATRYPIFFRQFDATIYLQAPNFDIVRAWRAEQEKETLGRQLSGLEHAALDRFIQHYERVTRAMLAGGHKADWVVQLDEERAPVRIERGGSG
ncbi:MAG: kinase [Alphaproteobacteria bacterium]|nr:kinase [Alphaproteobacteria bacterium]